VKRISCLAFALMSLAILAGCGGSSSLSSPTGSSTTTVPGQTEVLGHATIKFIGKPQSNVASNIGSIAVTGAAGASFTELNYLPAAVLANTSIAYLLAPNNELWMYSNGQNQPVNFNFASLQDYCFTHDGHLLLAMYDDQTHYNQIFECGYDGSGLVRLTSAAENHNSVSVTSNNSTLLFSDGTNLRTIPFAGGTESILGAGVIGKYSPNNTQIALLASTGPNFTPYLIAASGGPETPFDPSVFSSGSLVLQWSPDGTKLATTSTNSNGTTAVIADAANNEIATNLPQQTTYMLDPSFAPDGKTLAVAESGTQNVTTAFSLCTMSLGGGSNTPLVPSNGVTGAYFPQWSPYFGPRAFVGSGGSMFTSAAGFLWSERGSGFSSLLSFTATTPADATITAETSNGSSSSVVFDLHADKITSLKYTNGYYLTASAISPNTSDCLVSFDSALGTITTAVPFAQTKTQSKTTRKVLGAVATYTGNFPAIYDCKGVNLAPGGASTVSLDLTTGKLVNWH
jgi:hypothetical protein